MSGGITPPVARTHLGRRFSETAGNGGLVLPQCVDCSTVQYPPREVCSNCLGGNLEWREIEGAGEVVASVSLYNSLEPWFRDRLPWRIASVSLDAGGVVLVHAVAAVTESGTRVIVKPFIDESGEGVLVALPADAHDLDQGALDSMLKEYGVKS